MLTSRAIVGQPHGGLELPRFLSECKSAKNGNRAEKLNPLTLLFQVYLIPGIRPWSVTLPLMGTGGLKSVLAMEQYTRLFQSQFWDQQVGRFGHNAIKFTSEVSPALVSISRFKWDQARDRFGTPAADWMEHAWERLQDNSETEMLWLWLFYRTIDAVTANAALALWRGWSRWWIHEDRYAWVTGTTVTTIFDNMVAAIDAARSPDEPDVFPGIFQARPLPFASYVQSWLTCG